MSVFFVADTHFGESNIIRYENRPFDNAEEMNKKIIDNWNSVVGDEDIVYHLGDVGDVSYIKVLRGTKYLVKGNHDTMSNDFYRDAGFKEVYDLPVILDGYWMLSHEPLYINRNMPYANIYGHVHNNPIYKTSSIQSRCVSMERTNYFPLEFGALKRDMTSSIKMVVTDLDGTLLRDDKTISEHTANVIKALRARGILFTIATARPIRAVTEFLPFLEYDCAIYHNGAIVRDGSVDLEGFGISNPYLTINAILKDMPDSHIAVEANDIMYSNFDAERLWPGIEFKYTKDFTEVSFADKIIIEADSAEACSLLTKYISPELYIIPSESTIAMIMNKNATKCAGIASLANAHGLTLDEVVAFGDDFNDIDMLKACGYGVAVDNALPEVKHVAKYTCLSNMEDGVALWLEKVVLR